MVSWFAQQVAIYVSKNHPNVLELISENTAVKFCLPCTSLHAFIKNTVPLFMPLSLHLCHAIFSQFPYRMLLSESSQVHECRLVSCPDWCFVLQVWRMDVSMLWPTRPSSLSPFYNHTYDWYAALANGAAQYNCNIKMY